MLHPRSLLRPKAVNAVRMIRKRNDPIFISPQNEVEFWAVATRSHEANGLGMEQSRADRSLRRFERTLKFLPDSAEVHQEWRKLVVSYAVKGRQVYDARLVAVMLVHNISQILTFNITDFKRYQEITAVHPDQISASS